MSNAQRFVAAYNEIDHALRQMCCVDGYTPFRTLLKQASKFNSVLRTLKVDLQEFSELRNAIVHQSRRDETIAEPARWAVDQIEHIAGLLTNPPTVLPLFSKDVITMSATDLAVEALRLMSRHRFSQVPVYDGARYIGLLTADSLVFWLGAALTSTPTWDDLVTLKAVLESNQVQTGECFLARDASLCDLVEVFRETAEQGRRLDAILITEHGRSQETLLGIATVWDLPQVYQELGLYVG